MDVDRFFDCIGFTKAEFSRHQRLILLVLFGHVCFLLRLGEIQCPGHKLMLPHFAESLRELGRLGGGLENGEVESQPWPSV